MNPTDPYETGFPKKGTYEKIPYHDSVGNLGFRHLSLGLHIFQRLSGWFLNVCKIVTSINIYKGYEIIYLPN